MPHGIRTCLLSISLCDGVCNLLGDPVLVEAEEVGDSRIQAAFRMFPAPMWGCLISSAIQEMTFLADHAYQACIWKAHFY